MINPPLPPTIPKPHITDIGMAPQVFSPPATKETPTNMASPLLPSKVISELNFSNYHRIIAFLVFCPLLCFHDVLNQRLHPP